MLRVVNAVRYSTPLRQGSSLPAIVEADDGELYVVKFSGAGQGPKALIAELLGGEIARLLGLPVPEQVFVRLRDGFGRMEPDPEIQQLLVASSGMNIGLRFLPQAFGYNPMLEPPPAPDLASAIVWFDAYVTNIDRSDRNVNLLMWQRKLWLIDHGAALYFHHNWPGYLERSRTPFPMIREHTLLRFATRLEAAHVRLEPLLTAKALETLVNQIPDAWLTQAPFSSGAEHREAYLAFLLSRRDAASVFLEEALRAHHEIL